MAEVTNEYAIGGDYGRSYGAGIGGQAKAYADVAAENTGDIRAEVPTVSLATSLANAGEHRHLGGFIFQTDRDVLSTSAQVRVEAQQNTQAILVAINNSNLLNAERESRFLRDALVAQTAAANTLANNAALISQIGGMMNTAISTITNVVQNGNGDISLAL